jgi:hypothetical protein
MTMTRSRATAGLLALVLLATAACSEPPPGAQPGRDLAWQTAFLGDAIRVTLDDPGGAYHVDSVTLIDPDGRETLAREITRETVEGDRYGGPSVGVGGAGGSRSGASVGVGLSVPLGGPGYGSQRRTVAIIPIPDPGTYRNDALRFSITARMTGPGGAAYSATIPPPLP